MLWPGLPTLPRGRPQVSPRDLRRETYGPAHGGVRSPAPNRDSYGERLARVVHDPALLVWLDAPKNTRERPNENLAARATAQATLRVIVAETSNEAG